MNLSHRFLHYSKSQFLYLRGKIKCYLVENVIKIKTFFYLTFSLIKLKNIPGYILNSNNNNLQKNYAKINTYIEILSRIH